MKIIKFIEEAKKEIRRKKRSSVIVYFLLRFLVIVCMMLELSHGDLNNALLCLLSLILFLMPSILERKLKIDLPNTLEIIIYLFIFAAEILGEINNFYVNIPYWDTMLHTLNGFLCAAVGFSLVDLLNKNDDKLHLSPLYLCIVSFCFSMTVGVAWEMFEYNSDKILFVDTQKDEVVDKISTVYLDPEKDNNAIIIDKIDKTVVYDAEGNILTTIEGGYLDIGLNDTMEDLIVNFIGASVFCIFGYVYLKAKSNNETKGEFIEQFVPKRAS